MTEQGSSDRAERGAEAKVEAVYRSESRRVLATLIRLLGDFDLAEDALQEAFAAAMRKWPVEGVPRNPSAWLVSTGRFKAIDALRRRERFDVRQGELARRLAERTPSPPDLPDDDAIEDDQLRLIFTCCHPSLSPPARIALTLRVVCGLTTEEIAHAFLVPPATLAQRIVRAKSKIRDARIPYRVPARRELPERLDAVLHVIYLVFNEGYSASTGNELVRPELSAEAIRLGRLLLELLPEPEVMGLLALMLLQDSRRAARSTDGGQIVLLPDQDRALWDGGAIREAVELVERALRARRFGPYTLQAAIAAVHAEAPTAEETDWAQIVALYDVLIRLEPSPVVELNRAVAIAMRDGPEAGLEGVDAILARGELSDFHLAHAARADFLRRLGRKRESHAAYARALELARQEPERAFLRARMAELEDAE